MRIKRAGDFVEIQAIAHIESNLKEKFGIPRQSGLAERLRATVVFAESYRNPDALRGLEEFSHLWLLWEFSGAARRDWSPTVRPPRLGGNARMGVFATRSPFRPNPLGLSCVEIAKIEMQSERGPLIHVLGADLMDGTPIYDIKPYLPYADCRPDARGGFAAEKPLPELMVVGDDCWRETIGDDCWRALCDVLRYDPRPRYQCDSERVYGMAFGAFDVRFTVRGETLRVVEIKERENGC